MFQPIINMKHFYINNNNNNITKHKRSNTTNPNILSGFKTNTNFHSTIKSFYTTNNNNINYEINNDSKNQRPLNALYNSTFFPRSYKKKVYNKKYNTSLPMLTTATNFYPVQNKNLNEEFIKPNIDYYKQLYNKINEQNQIENENESLFSIIENNKITKDESEYINKFSNKKVKQNSFGLNINCNKKNYLNPKQSLQSLKINKTIMNKINNIMTSTQYDFFNQQFKNIQYDNYKKYLMPKPHIKLLQYTLENDFFPQKKNSNNSSFNTETDKNNFNKKISKINNLILNNNVNSNRTINDVIIRNSLIKETKFYFYKILYQNNKVPNSRVQATWTKHLNNNLILFGGLSSNVSTDLWNYDSMKNTWKKIKFSKEIKFNPKYGHSTVLFNECLYFLGGNLNINKIKYPMEDILMFNLKTNSMKILNFNKDNLKKKKFFFKVPLRRNHISELIGWNLVVHGGIDIEKEYLKNDNFDTIHINDASNSNGVLCDFMMLDLTLLKWSKLDNIKYKTQFASKNRNSYYNTFKRVYHSSCLVLNNDNLLKGAKLNIYHSEFSSDKMNNIADSTKKQNSFNPKYEGIYIFGGLDHNLNSTNNLMILHIFKNPLVLYEPFISGKPPSPRHSATISYYRPLNYIIMFGGKNLNQILNDLYLIDIMNFIWFKIELFGMKNEPRAEHCSEIIGDKLLIFGGSNAESYLPAKVIAIELDLFKNKKYKKSYDFAKDNLKLDPNDKTAKMVINNIDNGIDIPDEIYPFLTIDDN